MEEVGSHLPEPDGVEVPVQGAPPALPGAHLLSVAEQVSAPVAVGGDDGVEAK